ncbi:MAG: ABC transporter permease [Magnetospirillum sp. WYHS-4]
MAAPRRLWGLVRKEALQVVRDPSSIAIAFVLPAVLLFLFGYGVSLDPVGVRLGLVIENPTGETGSFVAGFAHSPYFAVTTYPERRAAEEDLQAGRLKGVAVLAADFGARLGRSETAPVQLLLDGTDANTARLVKGYVEGLWAKWLEIEALQKGMTAPLAVTLEPRVWFNPELRSRYFLVPGLIAIVMTLIGTLLTALVVAREWERGTMEALMTTPAGVGEILIGKLVPYFLLGMGGMGLSVAMGVWLFGVPLRGSFLTLTGTTAVFLAASLATGLFISTVARNQFVAGQVAMVAAFLPAFMLSGFIFEIGSMPWPIQAISHLVPARYFVSILQTLFLAGDVPGEILPDTAAIGAIAAFFLILTGRRTRKRLD